MQIDERKSSDETEDIKMRSERDIVENKKAENIRDEGSRMGKIYSSAKSIFLAMNEIDLTEDEGLPAVILQIKDLEINKTEDIILYNHLYKTIHNFFR